MFGIYPAEWWIPAKRCRTGSQYCEVQDLLLEVVDLEQEVPGLRSGGIPPPQFNPCVDLLLMAVQLVKSPIQRFR